MLDTQSFGTEPKTALTHDRLYGRGLDPRSGLLSQQADAQAQSMTGLLRELSPGPLAPEARIIPLDQAADDAVGDQF